MGGSSIFRADYEEEACPLLLDAGGADARHAVSRTSAQGWRRSKMVRAGGCRSALEQILQFGELWCPLSK
jgi:hypothetical protein